MRSAFVGRWFMRFPLTPGHSIPGSVLTHRRSEDTELRDAIEAVQVGLPQGRLPHGATLSAPTGSLRRGAANSPGNEAVFIACRD